MPDAPPRFDPAAAHTQLVRAAIDEYLRAPMRHGSAPNFTISNALDYALRVARNWSVPSGPGLVLAECLLTLALAWRRGPATILACAVALRHAVAEHAIDLPLGELPGPAGEGEGCDVCGGRGRLTIHSMKDGMISTPCPRCRPAAEGEEGGPP